MFDEYKGATDRPVATFGVTWLVDDLAADDFEALRDAMAKQWGPVRLGNEIQRVRTVFKYGSEAGRIDKPVRNGPQFKKPSAGVMRRHRAKIGERILEAKEVQQLLDKANVQVKAVILLGLNAGFGNGDCATLPQTALDLERGWLDYPRPKTGISRRCPLWPLVPDNKGRIISTEKLHAVTAALDAWQVARACLWHRMNELLATKGTARLRDTHEEPATEPELPAGVTVTCALSDLRVAARRLALHLDDPDSFPWLVLGDGTLALTAGSIECELQVLFTGAAADDADFWESDFSRR